jgi:hypothetical protein
MASWNPSGTVRSKARVATVDRSVIEIVTVRRKRLKTIGPHVDSQYEQT